MAHITKWETVRIRIVDKNPLLTLTIGVGDERKLVAKKVVENINEYVKTEDFLNQVWEIGFIDDDKLPQKEGDKIKCVFRLRNEQNNGYHYLTSKGWEKTLESEYQQIQGGIDSYVNANIHSSINRAHDDPKRIIWVCECLPNWEGDAKGSPKPYRIKQYNVGNNDDTWVFDLAHKRFEVNTPLCLFDQRNGHKNQAFYLEPLRVRVKVKKGKTIKLTYTPEKPNKEKIEVWDTLIGGTAKHTQFDSGVLQIAEGDMDRSNPEYNLFYLSCKRIFEGRFSNESTSGIFELDLLSNGKLTINFFYGDPEEGGVAEVEEGT